MQERQRAKEMAMRERETQELLKMGAGGGDKKKTRVLGKVRRKRAVIRCLEWGVMFCLGHV